MTNLCTNFQSCRLWWIMRMSDDHKRKHLYKIAHTVRKVLSPIGHIPILMVWRQVKKEIIRCKRYRYTIEKYITLASLGQGPYRKCALHSVYRYGPTLPPPVWHGPVGPWTHWWDKVTYLDGLSTHAMVGGRKKVAVVHVSNRTFFSVSSNLMLRNFWKWLKHVRDLTHFF